MKDSNVNKKTNIKVALFPVAGLGTRFLPITKSSPKEMLSIIDKPLIQYAVEEAIAAGIKQLIFVTNSTKRSLEDYFDTNNELEQHLREKKKYDDLIQLQSIIPKDVTCLYIRQKQAKGLGDAVLTAKSIIGGNSFAVILADDVISRHEKSNTYCLQDLLAVHQETQKNIICVEQVPPHKTHQYGMVSPTPKTFEKNEGFFPINGIVEKPTPEHAPSSFGVVGRYILNPRIFHYLEQTVPDKNNEIQLTDALSTLLSEQAIYAAKLQTKRFDCGSKLGYLDAILHFGLKHPSLQKDFHKLLTQYVSTLP